MEVEENNETDPYLSVDGLDESKFKFSQDNSTIVESLEDEGATEEIVIFETEPNPLKCYICGLIQSSKKEKFHHLDSQHSKDEFKCFMCNHHRSQTAKGHDSHLMLHEFPDLLSHACQLCTKNYRTGAELRRHIKLSHSDKSKRRFDFVCDLCGFTTFLKMNVKRHIKTTHLKIKQYRCTLCPDKKYTSKLTLDQHLIIKHGQQSDFVCSSCSRRFPAKSTLTSHLKVCGGPKSKFRERGDPNSYREQIANTDSYRCKICGQICTGKSKISQHYAQKHKHDNSCELCGATFNSYSNLKKHIQILHNKVHKFICDTCGKSFGQKNQLKSHENTHTGAKPFKCKFDICHFRSGDLSVISRHQKKCFRNPLNQFDQIIE